MELDEIKKVRLEKLGNLRAGGLDPYGDGFKPLDAVAQVLATFTEGREVALAGRLV
ncbi:MAG: lysine--tRNA ligase, partial [Candidatus Omnitrophica bacterium]|nr:lysine--tRNA ligase [Candidatus Omnitrophota bacterium]